MESFSSPKTERIACKVYRTRDQAWADVFDYIQRFHNPRRRHSTLSYVSPAEFEMQSRLAQDGVTQTGSSPNDDINIRARSKCSSINNLIESATALLE